MIGKLQVRKQREDAAKRESGLLEIYDGNVMGDREFCENINLECYDIVVPNILADIIIPLSAITIAIGKIRIHEPTGRAKDESL